MTIPTVDSLRAMNRKVDRRQRRAEATVNEMRIGNALHLYFVFGTPVWTLANGQRIDSAVAEIVIGNPNVVPVGKALIDGLKPQT
jgi:hypothetical protein